MSNKEIIKELMGITGDRFKAQFARRLGVHKSLIYQFERQTGTDSVTKRMLKLAVDHIVKNRTHTQRH